MDSHTLSQIFGYAGLGFKLASNLMPDAKRIRYLRLPSLLLGAFSFQADGQGSAAAVNYVATARTTIRSTSFGARHKNLLLGASLIPVAAVTAVEYEQPIDGIPLAISAFGGCADYTSQGRYQRALITVAGVSAIGYCLAKGNTAMFLSSLFSTIMSAYAAVKYDVRGAAGLENPNFIHDVPAYLYGLKHNAPTGATMSGQVASGETDMSDEEMYAEMLTNNTNRYFTGINRRLVHSDPAPPPPAEP